MTYKESVCYRLIYVKCICTKLIIVIYNIATPKKIIICKDQI